MKRTAHATGRWIWVPTVLLFFTSIPLPAAHLSGCTGDSEVFPGWVMLIHPLGPLAPPWYANPMLVCGVIALMRGKPRGAMRFGLAAASLAASALLIGPGPWLISCPCPPHLRDFYSGYYVWLAAMLALLAAATYEAKKLSPPHLFAAKETAMIAKTHSAYRWSQAPTVLLFLVSLVLPAVYVRHGVPYYGAPPRSFDGPHAPGYAVFYALPYAMFSLPWWANPMWVCGVTALHNGRPKNAQMFGLAATFLALLTLALGPWIYDGPPRLRDFHIGYYVWVGAMFALLAAATYEIKRLPKGENSNEKC